VRDTLTGCDVDPARVFVAGLSSGGYMATQLHVAYSRTFHGAAIFAAGPYYCAQGSEYLALYACGGNAYPTDLPQLVADTNVWAGYGLIDATSNLAGAPVYLLSGGRDPVVEHSVMDDLESYYRYYGADVTYNDSTPAGHAWVSPAGNNPCGVTESPFVNDCGIDPEEDFLSLFLGALNSRNGGPLNGRLVEFDQNRFGPGGYAFGVGLAETGFAYIPDSCSAGEPCSLLVALHGCLQNYETVGRAFIDQCGLDEWADTNNMVVLYPQTSPYYATNPAGCWDWWGYLAGYDANYAIKGGAQMTTIMNMVRAVATPACRP
jgi:poly(3-hydroxybutyrate) depolymerase